MLLSFIPAWLACAILYGTSAKQKILPRKLPLLPSLVAIMVLLFLAQIILAQYLPVITVIIVVFSLVCCFLPIITLISAYKNRYLLMSTGLVCMIGLLSQWSNIIEMGGQV
jgi:magnesium-transporting ATPase (P-type)